MRLRHLRILVAIDDAGQLTAAAKKLNVTQPALSKVLAEIERTLGEPMFERTPKGLVPTLHGLSLIRAARHALSELERASQEMQRLDRDEKHTLVIGQMPTTAMTFVGAAAAHLMQKNPYIATRIVDGATPALLPQLLSGKIDLVVGGQVRSAIHDGLEVIDLYTDPMVLVASHKHPVIKIKKPAWAQCMEYPWVVPPATNAVGMAFINAINRLGLDSPSRTMETVSTDTVMALLEHSQAIALVPQRLAGVLVAKGLAKIIGGELAALLNLRLPVKIFIPAGLPLSESAQEMIRSIYEVLGLPLR